MSVSPEPTVGIASARAIIEYFQHFNISPQKLATLLGVNESLLTTEDQRLPISLYHQIWETALEHSKAPELGLLMAQQEGRDDLGLVAHVVYNSKTLDEGLDHYMRLFSVVNEAYELELNTSGNIAHLKFLNKYQKIYNISDMERTLAIAVSRTIKAVGNSDLFVAVHFQHSAPDYIEKYAEVFPCKVLFNQACCEIIVDQKILALNPKQRNPHMRAATLNYANQILSRLFKRGIRHKVKRLIEKNLSDGGFDAEKASKCLHMSRQTLYRKLKNDNSSYSELMDQVKQEKAFLLLKEGSLPLTVISYDLGFSELSAFTRAFKRWTGTTPAEYRKQAIL